MLWYKKTQQEILNELKSSLEGLTAEEALQRLETNGKNQLIHQKKDSFFKKILLALLDRMTLVLFIAAVVSYIVNRLSGESTADSYIILAIVILNAFINVTQENKAEKALEALKRMTTPESYVLRNNTKHKIPSCDLVKGDIILLEKGCFVPADARILTENSLILDESVLTGEPFGIYKTSDVINGEDDHITVQKNMVWSGTSVIGGKATAIVIATGMNSYMGGIAGMLNEHSGGKTPLQKKLAKTSVGLGNAALLICLFIFTYSILKGRSPSDMFLTSVSLAVAAIPEGLPAIVTIMLSIGVTKIAKQQAIVKKLPAVETLGCATVICSDKTGTLTQNKMTVMETYGDETELSKLFMLNNDDSSPTETALKAFALKHVSEKIIEQHPRISEIPFDSKTKLMATLHKTEKGYLAVIKGAPEILEKYLNKYDVKSKNEVNRMALEALRVIAAGSAVLVKRPKNLLDVKYELCGFAGLSDPPRPEVPAAVATCRKAGIRTVMITGDHFDTAVATAKKIGIFRDGDKAYTQSNLEKLSQTDQRKAIYKTSVFARTTPEFKLKIVNELQKYGEVVAMTGDGVNDAPALKKSDIGCAMGMCGTDVTKEASDIVLTDDNFATIVGAVKYGRSIYTNIKRAVHFLISSNIGEIIVVFIAIAASLPTPLTAIQLLWVNLVTDSLPAIALGMEKPSDDVMNRKPIKNNKGLFNFTDKLTILSQGILIGLLSLAAFIYGLNNYGLLTGRTMAFAVISFSQLIHSFNMKSDKSLFKSGIFNNPALMFSFIISVIIQLLVLVIPQISNLFGVTFLDKECWKLIVMLSFAPLIYNEIIKFLSKKIKK